VKRKNLLLSGILFLLLFQIIQFSRAYHNPIPLVSGSGFNIVFSSGQALAFQGDNTLQIEVLSGLLNGSSGSLTIWNDRGTLSFLASNDSIIEVTSPDAEEGFEISITGATSTNQTDRFKWNVNINIGNTVTIFWSWRIESWIGKYTMLALGFGGIILMVASPTWVALEIRKKGLDADSIERGAYGMLLFCAGFGLLVMWLWA